MYQDFVKIAPKIKEDINQYIENRVTSFATNIVVHLIVSTPVLSQRALFSWNVTEIGGIEEPLVSFGDNPTSFSEFKTIMKINRKIRGSKLPNSRVRDPFQEEAIKRVMDNLLDQDIDFSNIKIYNAVQNSSNVYYIGFLNEGQSEQADPLFVINIMRDILSKHESLPASLFLEDSKRDAYEATNLLGA